MGSQLVAKVFATWAPHVGDKAFRVLMRMAHTALDETNERAQACLYFGGPDLLAATMPGTGTEASKQRIARRALEELVALGAVELVNRAGNGRRQVYRLTLWDPPKVGAYERKKSAKFDEWVAGHRELADNPSPPQPDNPSPPQPDNPSPRSRTTRVRPRNQEEPPQELTEENGVEDGAQVTDATREPDPPHPEPISSHPLPPCGDPSCFLGYVKKPGIRGNQRCPVCNPVRTKPAWGS
jgi:hypothetical protein